MEQKALPFFVITVNGIEPTKANKQKKIPTQTDSPLFKPRGGESVCSLCCARSRLSTGHLLLGPDSNLVTNKEFL